MAETRNIVKIVLKGENLTKKELDQVNKQLDTVGKTLQSVGRKSLVAGAALGAAGLAAVKFAGDLESNLIDALTLIPRAGQDFTALKESMAGDARALARELNVSAELVASGYYQVLSTGAEVTSADFKELTRTGLVLSKVTGLDLPSSIEKIADTVNAFSLDMGKNAAQVADVAFTTSRLAATTVPQLTDAYREAAPAAAAVGQTLEGVSAILGAFAQAGVKGVRAGTSFRIILNRLSAGGDEVKKELKALNVEVFNNNGSMRSMIDILEDLQTATADYSDEQNAATLKVLAGEEAFSKLALLLTQDIDVLRKWETQLESGGALSEALDVKLTGVNEAFAAAKLGAQGVAVALGTQLSPGVEAVTRHISVVLNQFEDWIDLNPELAKGLTIVTLALVGGGGLATGLGTTIRLVNILRKTSLVSFGPAGLITLAVVGTAIAITSVVSALKKAKRELEEIVDIEGVGKLTGAQAEELRGLEAELETGFKTIFRPGRGDQFIAVKIALSDKDVAEIEGRIDKLKQLAQLGATDDELATNATIEIQKRRWEAAEKLREADEQKAIAARARELTQEQGHQDKMAELAEKRADRATERRKKQLARKIEGDLEDELDNIGDQFETSLTGGIAAAFANGENNARGWGATVLQIIAQIISRLLVAAAIRIITGGFGAAEGGNILSGGGGVSSLAAGGGVINVGPIGRDAVPLIGMRDERILSTKDNANLTRMLEQGAAGTAAAGGQVLHQHFHTTAMTASRGEATKFGRISTRQQDRYNRSFIARGRR